MALKSEEQLKRAIENSREVLIAFKKEWDVDAVATSLALAQILRSRGKKADVAADGFVAPRSLQFLPDINAVQKELRQLQKFVVRLDTGRVGIDSLSYDKKDEYLDIILTPKGGQFENRDISSSSSAFRYDTVITVGAPDYNSLGSLFARHPDLFYQSATINIDNDPANEHYGNINVVDLAATSAAEIVFDAFPAKDERLLVPDVATCLLTGLFSRTKSFKTTDVTPNTLKTASELMAAGARRDDIVQNLYRTRSLSTLKLWGRALARIKYDPAIRMAWTLLVRQDFIHAGATEEYLPDVLGELISNSPEADIMSVIYEQESVSERGKVAGVCALVSSEKHADVLGLVSSLEPQGHRKLARICFPNIGINEAEKTVLNTICQSLGVAAPEQQPLMPDMDRKPAAPEAGK